MSAQKIGTLKPIAEGSLHLVCSENTHHVYPCVVGSQEHKAEEDCPTCVRWIHIKQAEKLITMLPEETKQEPEQRQPESDRRFNEITKAEHYNSSPATCKNCGHQIECIDVVRHMDFAGGNIVKYLWRFDKKGVPIKDLQKCAYYIQTMIENAIKKFGGEIKSDIQTISKNDQTDHLAKPPENG